MSPMDEEEFLSLFDNIWFYQHILSTTNSPPAIRPTHSKPKQQVKQPRAISNVRRRHHRYSSEESTNKTADPVSPNSVLPTPKFKSILSGKAKDENPIRQTKQEGQKRLDDPVLHHGKFAKSLYKLEMEELKGFQDLGFTFDEAEIDSRLASIVPALQRLGKNAGEDEPVGGRTVSRPYLSEAWEAREEEENPLLNWRISTTGDGIDVKEQLRWWAHAVASTVRRGDRFPYHDSTCFFPDLSDFCNLSDTTSH